MEKFRHIDTWIFDLDNTLYDAESNVMAQVRDRMTEFLTGFFQIPAEDAAVIRQDYWKKYGTTLRGLMVEHNIDPHHFLSHAHDIDLQDVPPCGIISEYLEHLPGKKIIFTNAPLHFATRMTKHLGIDRHFDHVFAIENAEFLCKPAPEPYHAVIKNFRFDPARACMFEDMAINLKPAADLGMTTVWLHGGEDAEHPHVHHKAEKLAVWLQQTIEKKR